MLEYQTQMEGEGFYLLAVLCNPMNENRWKFRVNIIHVTIDNAGNEKKAYQRHTNTAVSQKKKLHSSISIFSPPNELYQPLPHYNNDIALQI